MVEPVYLERLYFQIDDASPTNPLFFLMNRTVAVHPDVLGKPAGVFGQFSSSRNSVSSQNSLPSTYAPRIRLTQVLPHFNVALYEAIVYRFQNFVVVFGPEIIGFNDSPVQMFLGEMGRLLATVSVEYCKIGE
jgi:hypothetical protein